eukprot:11195042-Alexandrium_andersonii.AAC.1
MNLGYGLHVLALLVVEAVVGQPWPPAIQRQGVKPLELRKLRWGWAAWAGGRCGQAGRVERPVGQG